MIRQKKISYFLKRFEIPAIIGAYLLIASLLHLIITFEFLLSGEMYAETATNYYSIAISDANLFSQLFATDHGYISPILRIGPYIANAFLLNNQGFIYLFWAISFFFVVITPSILIGEKFKHLHPDLPIRALCALVISSMFNFESRVYINSSYVFIALISIYLINYYRGGILSRVDMLIISLIILAKPLTIALIPLFFLDCLKGKNKLFFVTIIFTLIINTLLISDHASEYVKSFEYFQVACNTLILTFYNIGKIFLLYIPSIVLKIYSLKQVSTIIGFTAFVGFFILLVSILKTKRMESRALISTLVIVNILWSALIIAGAGASAPLDNKINSDFNRYDLITALNILTLVSLSSDWWPKKFVRMITLFILIFTTVIYSTASIYYFNTYIKKNILYIGTSTWISMKDRPEYLGCALLSPLGWGYNCNVITNVRNRLDVPKIIKFNKEITINVPAEMRGGFLALFSEEKISSNKINVINNLDNNSLGENFNLAFNRNAVIYKIECNENLYPECPQKLILKEVELYASPGVDATPLFSLFNK